MVWTLERRQAQSKAMTGRPLPQSTRDAISRALKGRTCTWKSKISKSNKGRTPPPDTPETTLKRSLTHMGERNPNHKLTEAQVLTIYHSTLPNTTLASAFGVCATTCERIRCGRTWRHLTGGRK